MQQSKEKYELEETSELFAKALANTVTVRPEHYTAIENHTSGAMEDIILCENSLAIIDNVCDQLESHLELDKLKSDLKELDSMFHTVDVMNLRIIPALSNDLDALEQILTDIEKNQMTSYTTAVQSWFKGIRPVAPVPMLEHKFHNVTKLRETLHRNDRDADAAM